MPNTRKARLLSAIGEELKEDPPAILAKTQRKEGAKAREKQRRAILLGKARKAGANIPYG